MNGRSAFFSSFGSEVHPASRTKRIAQENEAVDSPPSSAKLKGWDFNEIPAIKFHRVVVGDRDNVYLYCLLHYVPICTTDKCW
jgi:hypothetical protein